MRFLMAALTASLIFAGTAGGARDLALLIDQQDYRYLPDLRNDRALEDLSQDLQQAGFEVTRLKDARLGAMRAALFSTQASAQSEPGRLLIVLRGHVLSDGRDNWLVAQDARRPDGFDIGSKAIALGSMDTTLQAAAGHAVLAVITQPAPLSGLADLTATTQAHPVPQGVTTVFGPQADVVRSLSQLLQPGVTSQEVAQNAGRATIAGFRSRNVAFTPEETPQQPLQDMGELAYWSAVRDIGSKEALDAYLNRYPTGRFVTEARRLISQQISDRETQIQQAEQSLGLNRSQRRNIQKDLNTLGYNTRGVDGVFGPATRSAVAAWQADTGYEAHGYLNLDQLRDLQEFARLRAAELEEEARRRRAIQDARDRAYWQDTGARDTEAGYRSYLREFPNGVYATLARDRLQDIENARRPTQDQLERTAWNTASTQNTERAYQNFLNDFPNGLFAPEAQARLSALRSQASDDEARKRYLRAEQSVVGNSAARLLIETRLSRLGLDPGPVDGNFNEQTRAALRQLQKSRNMQPTGYVNQATMLQLLLGR
ncbi:peptidoglycan-binding domain-containing protein [Cognatishimia sp. WU-CL00825]|uniref:peptidoglycan-binding domain-containing protein n=1 Tax=Cognatishimia sp. WU-CL00825 TaxID=3127658 RepID=UPI0031042655